MAFEASEATEASVADEGSAEASTEDSPETPSEEESTPESAPQMSQPVDLTARRMLVAGLRPITDPPFP